MVPKDTMTDELKIEGLRGMDPRTVPLPHGTQVTTAVERVAAGRSIPVGSVGTVVGGLPDGGLRVRVVGRGEHDFARHELRPAKAGQLRFAVARARNEVSLRPCALLESTVGSRAWGLANEDSDHDLRGVFLLPFGWRQGLAEAPQVLVSLDGSETYWEVERTVRQALRADPNTLEMLYVPQRRILDPLGQRLIDQREIFVSRAIYGSFGRYALAQAKRLRQSLRLAEHRGMVFDWLREEPQLTLDAVADRLAASTGDDEARSDRGRARQYLKQLYRALYDQGLLPDNSFAGLAELAGRAHLELELPRELRPKNAYNLLRIVCCAVQWLRTGEPIIETHGELRDRLLQIKGGHVPLRQALEWTEEAAGGLDEAREDSPLPVGPDVEKADALLRELRCEAAQRWFKGEAGPWGADAARPESPKEVPS